MKSIMSVTSTCAADKDRICFISVWKMKILLMLKINIMFKLNLYTVSFSVLLIELFFMLLRLNWIKNRLLDHSEAFIMMFR